MTDPIPTLDSLKKHLEVLEKIDAALRDRDAEMLRNANFNPLGVAMLTLDGRWIKTNNAFRGMIGYSEAELHVTSLEDITHDDDVEADGTRQLHLRSGSIRCFETEKRFLRKDGTVVRAFVEVSLVPDESGTPVLMMFEVQDVDAGRHLQDRYRHAQKIETLGRIAGCVAHDFNNVLTAILGFSQLLYIELKQDSELRDFAAEIIKSANRAVELTGQLKVFSRRDDRELTVMNLNEIVTELDSMLRRLIGEKVTLDIETSTHTGNSAGDRGQIEQVIVNLVVNARDAMPEGGVIKISTGNFDRMRSNPDGSETVETCVRLLVSDEGIGMNDETQCRIFDPYYTTKGKKKGAGLGLYTAKSIVDQSGGDIEVSSEPGKGSTFTIYLPRARDAEEMQSQTQTATDLAAGSETILLVEDEGDVRRFVSQVLSRSGYQVVEAADGAEALAIVTDDATPIQMILTDFVMPNMNGDELAERVCQDRPDIKVLYMSGYANEDRLKSENLKPVGSIVLKKPFSPQALMGTVHQLLDAS
jgi:two-component system cell cycle sensor histidine kinase/response regulator CckA